MAEQHAVIAFFVSTDGRVTTVPMHEGKTLKPKTLAAIAARRRLDH